MKEDIILRRLRSGDPAGLEALMTRYIPYVSTIVWNILRNCMSKEDAEEVVSDVFVAAWNQADDIQAGCVKAWLGAVARNKAKTKLRAAGQTLPLEEEVLELPDECTPSAAAEQAEERKLVQKALDQLEPTDREIFLRHYYYAQTVEEISQRMHLNPSTIKTKLRRGRLRLKTILQRCGVA